MTVRVIIFLVQEILQHVRPPNFEWSQSFYWYFTLEFGHQGFFEKNNQFPLMFLIWKQKLSLLGLKNRWANMLINILNQKNDGFTIVGQVLLQDLQIANRDYACSHQGSSSNHAFCIYLFPFPLIRVKYNFHTIKIDP